MILFRISYYALPSFSYYLNDIDINEHIVTGLGIDDNNISLI